MRVLFVIDTMGAGGAEKVLLDTVRALRDRADVSVLALLEYPDEPNLVAQISQVADYRCLYSYRSNVGPVGRLLNGLRIRLLRRMLRRMSPRLLHALFVRGGYDVEVAYLEGRATRLVSGCPKGRRATFAWVHTDVEANPWADPYFKNLEEERRCYRAFDRVFAVSSETAAAACRKFGVAVEFVQNVIDSESVAEKSRERAPSFRRPGQVEVVSVGRLEEVKAPDRLVRAVGHCVERGIAVHATLVGDGSLRAPLEKLVDELSLHDYVTFAGYEANPYPAMAAADLVVCSSRAEGFSGAVTEALLLGKPVVTTDCAGMRDLLGESRWGLIVENSQEGLDAGLERVLSAPGELERLAALAKRRGEDFSCEALAGRVLSLLEGGACAGRGSL